MGLRERILAGRGLEPPDLVLKGGRVVNVFTNEVQTIDVAIRDGVVVGLGEYEGPAELELGGAFVLPGLIDGHLHIESTLLAPGEFARAVVPCGTTSVVVDPHEIGNVLGPEGIRLLLAATAGLPLNVFVNVPSCVPASSMEMGGHVMQAEDMAPLLAEERVVGIAEVMNFPGVLNADPEVLTKLELGHRLGVPIDGHAPRVRGKDLCGYVAAGIESDHETTLADEAEDKLRLGMWLMVRQGSTEHNLAELLPVVRKHRARRAMLVTDDRTPTDLRDEGHIDHALWLAIREGLDPVWAVQMATINPAERFGLKRLGAVAPSYAADLMIARDLADCRPWLVLKDGQVVARDGVALFEPPPFDWAPTLDSVHVGPLDRASLRLAGGGKDDVGTARCRVIGLVAGQIVTEHLIEEAPVKDGEIRADPSRDLLKFAVVERHRATGRVGVGLVKGLGLRFGALASSVAHDAHNIGVVGADDEDMLLAVRAVAELRGGLAVVAGGQVVARLPLPIGGLMSDERYETVARRLEEVEAAAAGLGCTVRRPFMTLSFLALSVIPSLKLTDRGLVDVDAWRLVSLRA